MKVNPWNRALVTGASSGIGLEICKKLAKEGTDLVIVARREDLLEELSKELDVDVEVITADLKTKKDLDTICDRLSQDEKPIDLLVNNAGFGTYGKFVDLNIKTEQDMIKVNIIALQRLAYCAAKTMAERKRGWILNVSSIASFAPYPRCATYAATKAFVTSFSEALRSELEDSGIVVSALCPGPVKTEFQKISNINLDVMPNIAVMKPDEVAEIALNDFAKKKAIIIPGLPMKATHAIIKLAPASIIRRASAYISSQRKNED